MLGEEALCILTVAVLSVVVDHSHRIEAAPLNAVVEGDGETGRRSEHRSDHRLK